MYVAERMKRASLIVTLGAALVASYGCSFIDAAAGKAINMAERQPIPGVHGPQLEEHIEYTRVGYASPEETVAR